MSEQPTGQDTFGTPSILPEKLAPPPGKSLGELERKVERLEEIILDLFTYPRDSPLYRHREVLPDLNKRVYEMEREHGKRR